MLNETNYAHIQDLKTPALKNPALLTKAGLYIELCSLDIFQRANNLPLNKVLGHLGQGICFVEIDS